MQLKKSASSAFSASKIGFVRHAALDIGYIDQKIFETEYEQARKTKALIGGFKRSLRKRTP